MDGEQLQYAAVQSVEYVIQLLFELPEGAGGGDDGEFLFVQKRCFSRFRITAGSVKVPSELTDEGGVYGRP